MYIDSVMNYTGSKFKLLEQILPKFDYDKKTFVDLFTGGGSVYINVVDKFDGLLINDVIPELIGIHKGIIDGDDIIDNTKNICPDKDNQEEFLKLRDDFNENKSPDKLWALMLSCNSNLMRFNQKGKFNQTWGKRSWNSNTDKKVEILTKHIRQFKEKLKFISENFNDVPLLKDSFYYIDPPYGYIKSDDGSIGNKQISEAGYNSFYYKQDDMNLYDYCHSIDSIGSTFMLSGVLSHGDSTSWILDKLIQDGFSYEILNYDYEKINKTGKSKNTKEIIIKNY